MPRNASQHTGTDLVVVVKREDIIGMAMSLEDAMRSTLPFDRPANPQQRR
jgi:hypothetical protein